MMMQEVSSDLPAFTETNQAADPQGVLVELVLDGHRVIGELQGAHRRLVDILNTVDEPFVVVHDGELDDPHRREEAPHRFPVVYVCRSAILFAVPRAGPAPPASPFEAVEKVPVLATIVLPGFEITGNVYLLPGVDPIRSPLLSMSRFIPLTDATVVAAQHGGQTRLEPIVVVNLARALLWAPKGPAAP